MTVTRAHKILEPDNVRFEVQREESGKSRSAAHL